MLVIASPSVPLCRQSSLLRVVTVHEQLLARCADGDEAAFSELYELVVDSVYGLARAVVRDPSMAEEVTHDVLLEVWHKASSFDPARGSAKAWIATITRRRAIDVVRSEQAGRNREVKVGTSAPVAPADPVADSVVGGEERSDVQRGLGALTDLQREVIDLAYFRGLTYREVALKLDVPLGTVKTRMRDGLRKLAGTLGGADE